ncbi:MAG: ABC transporter ATP-binding protein [Candidatus Thermoplasmatota archaeon]|nr:ABC transporter ATP-binding protein [Candidatus Thermoplasmatota archaeon]
MMHRLKVNDVTKIFKIGSHVNQGVLSRTLSLVSGRERRKKITVLRGVSFNVDAGECVGLIGSNGAGKSTLMRILTDIYPKTSGRIKARGNVVPLIGLGNGFLIRLTMRDNIYLMGSLFNMSRKTIKEDFRSIVEFAELEDYVDTKLFQFSEGMKQRLAFSIAVHSSPDILLLDEVFEVGDNRFRKKSSAKIKEMVERGVSVILISHELWMIEKHCERTIWLQDGRVHRDGITKDVVKEYRMANS